SGQMKVDHHGHVICDEDLEVYSENNEGFDLLSMNGGAIVEAKSAGFGTWILPGPAAPAIGPANLFARVSLSDAGTKLIVTTDIGIGDNHPAHTVFGISWGTSTWFTVNTGSVVDATGI